MFDRIAPRYDGLNRLLSLRRDVAWRRQLAARLKGRGPLKVLDLATGTGDQLIALHGHGVELAEAVGLDMSAEMLAVGRAKLKKRGLDDRIVLEQGDAVAPAFDDNRFDAVTISFGIRNVEAVDRALGEMLRVLKPGGQALILEFSLPRPALLRRLYLVYLRRILPRVGGLLSGDARAYRYLNETVETFPYGEAFLDSGLAARPLTLGVATLYRGEKPAS